MNTRRITESGEQQAVIEWCRMNMGRYPMLKNIYHAANEGKRNPATGKRMVSEGLKKGVPDLCLPVPRGSYGALYIDMKIKPNKPTQAQEECIRDFRSAGNLVCVCYSAEEAIKIIERYLTED